MALADENTTVEVIFTDDHGKHTTYDCSTPTNCFEAFLEQFLEAHKSGSLNSQNQNAVKNVLVLLDEDCYNAGREAFFFIRRTNCLGFHFKKIR